MTRYMHGKHSRTIDSVVNRLCDSNTEYSEIIVEEKFYDPNSGRDGECDIHTRYITPNKKYLLVFEIKSSYSRKNAKKAEYQCSKDVNYYKRLYKCDKAFRFQVFGHRKDDSIDIEWITNPLVNIKHKSR